MHSKPSDVVGDQIQKRRQRLGLNREQLANECAKLGAPELTYAAITNIETGRRKNGERRRDVTVEELLVFAHALAVPPLMLMFPLGEEDEVPLPPDWKGKHPHAAWKWATGEDSANYLGSDGRLYTDFSEVGTPPVERFYVWRDSSSVPPQLYRALQTAQDRFKRAADRYKFSAEAYGDDSSAAESAWSSRESALNEFAQAVNALIGAGLKPPGYTAGWRAELISTGFIARPEQLPVADFEDDTPQANPRTNNLEDGQ